MAKYRPPKVSGNFEYGEKGKAKVRIQGKAVLVRFEESGNVHKFKRTRDLAKLKPGVWYIQLNGDETEIYAFRPFTGVCLTKVSSFVAKEGEEPRPKIKEYKTKEGREYTITSFTVLLEVLEPEQYRGLNIPFMLRYNFREAEDNGKSVVGLPDKGRHSKLLEEFCDLTGVWKFGPMEYKDNVLPDVEKRILKADQAFNIVLKDGWVDTIYEADEPTDESEWEENAEVEPVPDPDDEEEDLSWDEE